MPLDDVAAHGRVGAPVGEKGSQGHGGIIISVGRLLLTVSSCQLLVG